MLRRAIAIAVVGALVPTRALAIEPPVPAPETTTTVEAPPASSVAPEATAVVPVELGQQAKITTTTTTTVELGAAGRDAAGSATASSPNARRIWIESDSTGVTLNRWDGGGRSGVICKDACGELVDDRGKPVYVDGDRMLPSTKIVLPRGQQELVLSVRGNLGLFISGMVIVGLGGVGVGFGVNELSWYGIDRLASERKLGVALIGAGAAAIAAGLLIGLLGRTRVRVRAR